MSDINYVAEAELPEPVEMDLTAQAVVMSEYQKAVEEFGMRGPKRRGGYRRSGFWKKVAAVGLPRPRNTVAAMVTSQAPAFDVSEAEMAGYERTAR